jgi:hypothetical protein
MRDDAAFGDSVVERPHRVARAAKLERADALEILAFEDDPASGGIVDGTRREYGCAMRVRRDARGGGFDVGERD